MTTRPNPTTKRAAKRHARRKRDAHRLLALYTLTELKRTDGETRHVTMRLPAALLDRTQKIYPHAPLSRAVAAVLSAGLRATEVPR